jgi:hypothetical protein
VARSCHHSGGLLASLGRVKHDYLIARCALGGNATWLLKHAPEEIAMSTLPQDLRATLGQHAHATLMSLAVNLGCVMLTLPPA